MIFNESSTISDWHYLQLSEPEYLAMIAESGSRFYGFDTDKFVVKTAGDGWDRETVLSGEIDQWLREQCGFAQIEYWGFPRVLYSVTDAEWHNEKFEQCRGRWDQHFTPAGYNQRNWRFRPTEKRIYFRRKEYAMAFKLAFHSVEDGYRG